MYRKRKWRVSQHIEAIKHSLGKAIYVCIIIVESQIKSNKVHLSKLQYYLHEIYTINRLYLIIIGEKYNSYFYIWLCMPFSYLFVYISKMYSLCLYSAKQVYIEIRNGLCQQRQYPKNRYYLIRIARYHIIPY